jgi:hypothetical protein
MKSCEYGPRRRIHYPSFSSKLKNEPNKLECYITLDSKDLPLANTQLISYEENEGL